LTILITQLLGYIFEGIGLASGIIIASIVMKKDSKYIGNRLMAAAMILIGVYMGAILIYDILYPIFKIDLIIQIFYRICVIAMFYGTMFLFFSVNVMSRSSSWYSKKNTIPYVVLIFIYAVSICFIHFLEILPGDQVNTRTSPMYPLYILIVGVMYFIIFSMVNLYRFGIRKSEGVRKKKMVTFFSGLSISLLAVLINVLSNVLSDPLGILDVLFFGVLAAAMVVMTFGFVGK
jgi:hypothetical protein